VDLFEGLRVERVRGMKTKITAEEAILTKILIHVFLFSTAGTNITSGFAANGSFANYTMKRTATVAATPPQGSAVTATTVSASAPYTLSFNVTLVAAGPSTFSSSSESLSGTWVDEASGGRVLIETDGRFVHMTEVR